MSVDDLAELFSVELPDDGVDTVGGLLAQELGLVPIPGAEVDAYGLHLVAESAGGRRNVIDSVLVSRVREPVATPEDEEQTVDGR
jgi:Mg2+/Co2+ transporter CorC